MSKPEKIIRQKRVMERTGLSASSIWRLEKIGQFPARRKLGSNSVGWIESEINEWITSREKLQLGRSAEN